jgi:endonuclease/exonuclease/phosphatase family metal-dependent hydrolase
MVSDDLSESSGRSPARGGAATRGRVAAVGLAVLISVGLVGQVIRDRSVATALLMYLPLIPLGLAALGLDLSCRGRALPRPRFGLTLIGGVAIGWSSISMIGTGVVGEPRPGDREVVVLHWNVQWGGGILRSRRTLGAQRFEILRRSPDLVILSEAPPGDWLKQLVGDIGAGASCVRLAHGPNSQYWFRLAVCSRWPIRLEERLPLPGGVAMSVIAEVHRRPLRLLVVDGVSSPFRSRRPFLRAIAQACREAAAAGQPYDVVVGDFNTPSRALGFDDLTTQGYRLAGRSATGWRATFPAWLPLYDIDHVWLAPGLRIRSCNLFNGPATDHRGQLVRVLVAAQPREGRM